MSRRMMKKRLTEMSKVSEPVSDNVVSFPKPKKESEIESYFHCAKCMDETHIN